MKICYAHIWDIHPGLIFKNILMFWHKLQTITTLHNFRGNYSVWYIFSILSLLIMLLGFILNIFFFLHFIGIILLFHSWSEDETIHIIWNSVVFKSLMNLLWYYKFRIYSFNIFFRVLLIYYVLQLMTIYINLTFITSIILHLILIIFYSIKLRLELFSA